MRTILFALCVTAALSANIIIVNDRVEGSVDNVKDFVGGFALSARVLERIPDALTCVSSVGDLKAVLNASIAQIKSGNFDQIVHAIQNLTLAIQGSAATCGDTTIEGKDYIFEVLHIVKGNQ
jgi:hypothetical protein